MSLWTKKRKYPLTLEDMNHEFYEKHRCPDCLSSLKKHLIIGPSGGVSTNVKCNYCGSFFNDQSVFGLDRISWRNHNDNINQCMSDINFYQPFTPYIIRHWHSVYTREIKNWNILYVWCEQQGASWSIKSGKVRQRENIFSIGYGCTFFFKSKQTAALFKLKWI